MLEIDLEQALNEIGLYIERLHNPVPFLIGIGKIEVENVKKRIEDTKLSPDGENWLPWADSTAKARERKGNAEQGLLWDRGDLLNSIHAQVDGEVLEVGSDLDFASYLQLGTEKMPARPFLGWNEASFPLYQILLAHFIETGIIGAAP